MTFGEALAAQSEFLQVWFAVIVLGGLVFPALLLIWRAGRVPGLVVLAATGANAIAVPWLYAQMGYVRLLGLPHLFIWGPAVLFLVWTLRNRPVPRWPRAFMLWIVAILGLCLIIDAVDTVRWLAGDRTPTILPG